MTDADPNLIAAEVAEQLRMNVFTARRLMASGEIEAAMVGGKWLARQSAVDAYQESLIGGRAQRKRRKRKAS